MKERYLQKTKLCQSSQLADPHVFFCFDAADAVFSTTPRATAPADKRRRFLNPNPEPKSCLSTEAPPRQPPPEVSSGRELAPGPIGFGRFSSLREFFSVNFFQ